MDELGGRKTNYNVAKLSKSEALLLIEVTSIRRPA